jgi:hypothetical protein
VRIDGHASGLGQVRHREFAMASGEMSEAEFTAFLTLSCTLLARNSIEWLHPFLMHRLAPRRRADRRRAGGLFGPHTIPMSRSPTPLLLSQGTRSLPKMAPTTDWGGEHSEKPHSSFLGIIGRRAALKLSLP